MEVQGHGQGQPAPGGGGDQTYPPAAGGGVSVSVSNKPSKRSFLKRHKSKQCMSGNGFPSINPDHMEVDCSSTTSTFIPSIDSKFLSAQTDRTYNEMLHNRISTKQAPFSRHSKNSLQSRIYNFLERPTGWKCFIYHFTV